MAKEKAEKAEKAEKKTAKKYRVVEKNGAQYRDLSGKVLYAKYDSIIISDSVQEGKKSLEEIKEKAPEKVALPSE